MYWLINSSFVFVPGLYKDQEAVVPSMANKIKPNHNFRGLESWILDIFICFFAVCVS